MTSPPSLAEQDSALESQDPASPAERLTNSHRAGLVLRSLVGVTVFGGAFLLFQVQPLISKAILPWFGGTAGVWTVCVLLFQVLLLCGYALAHFALRWIQPGPWLAIHGILLVLAVVLLPITPHAAWRPVATLHPQSQILRIVLASVGLQFLLLSTTGPLLQAWFARAFPARSPYRLYALSNAGSLLALVSYPFVFEAYWPVSRQAAVWSAGFVLYAVLLGLSLTGLMRAAAKRAAHELALEDVGRAAAGTGSPPTVGAVGTWFVLAAIPSGMLIATTNQVCLDIASVPFLWVLPLGLYLLSFILCFERERWTARWFWAAAVALTSLGMWSGLVWDARLPIVAQITIFFAGMFASAMFCHGELARSRPAPRDLTLFYLILAAGGAAGGIAVGLLAPLVFATYWEMQAGILATLVVVVIACFPQPGAAARFRWSLAGWLLLTAVFVAVGVGISKDMAGDSEHAIVTLRNFYGVLRVKEYDRGHPAHSIALLNGRITHGDQYLDPQWRQTPTTYYSPVSGIGQVLRTDRGEKPWRVGIVGLGVGTLAAYAEPGDLFRFYEINPAVESIANNVFSYLRESAGTIEVRLGDARLLLEQENAASVEQFDVLVIDAFSGDAIPTHLLTREALEVYLRRLQAKGVLCLHVSNRHFDLARVVAALAPELGCAAVVVSNPSQDAGSVSAATWILVAREPERLAQLQLQNAKPLQASPPTRWTDDYCNPFRVLRSFPP